MEANNYRSVTPLKKKRKKITMTAALVLCLVFFVVGIACGRSVSSSKQEKEANEKIQKLEMDYNETLSAHQEKIDTLEGLLNEKKGELADAKKQISDINKAQEEKQEEEVKEEKTAQVEEPTQVQEEKQEEPQKKGTSSVLRRLIIICLVIIIVVCILIALSILIKKNDDDDYDDEEDEEYIEEEYYEDEEVTAEEDNE